MALIDSQLQTITLIESSSETDNGSSLSKIFILSLVEIRAHDFLVFALFCDGLQKGFKYNIKFKRHLSFQLIQYYIHLIIPLLLVSIELEWQQWLSPKLLLMVMPIRVLLLHRIDNRLLFQQPLWQ